MSDKKNELYQKEESQILENEKNLVLNHDYDGIKELNHPLPRWWLLTFYATIIFSIPYWIYYHHMDGPTLKETHQKEMAHINQVRADYEASKGGFNQQEFQQYVATLGENKEGAKIYKRRCRSCHGEEGEGGIGPNLADNYWIHGKGDAEGIYTVIDKGVVDKGMAAWGETIGAEGVMAVTAYVMNFKGTNPANAKEPQGKEFP
jgi:cytochrome c oxidase cbb3-type subunit 3